MGEEITTDRGDVLVLFITEHIKDRGLFKVIDNVRSQGGIIVIPHPFRPFQRFGYPLAELVGKIDAVETFNARSPDSSNKAAAKSVKGLAMATVGSSDAHIIMDIGKGYTLFDGELRDAIKERTTTSAGSNEFFNAFLSHLAANWFKGSWGQKK